MSLNKYKRVKPIIERGRHTNRAEVQESRENRKGLIKKIGAAVLATGILFNIGSQIYDKESNKPAQETEITYNYDDLITKTDHNSKKAHANPMDEELRKKVAQEEQMIEDWKKQKNLEQKEYEDTQKKVWEKMDKGEDVGLNYYGQN